MAGPRLSCMLSGALRSYPGGAAEGAAASPAHGPVNSRLTHLFMGAPVCSSSLLNVFYSRRPGTQTRGLLGAFLR